MRFQVQTSKAKFQLSNVNEQRVILVIRDRSNGASLTFTMAARGLGRWERTVELPEGRYEARYYAGDENRMTYYGPAVAGIPLGTKGLDAVFQIGVARAVHVVDDQPRDQATPLRALFARMQFNNYLAAAT